LVELIEKDLDFEEELEKFESSFKQELLNIYIFLQNLFNFFGKNNNNFQIIKLLITPCLRTAFEN
jgi:hypothetical protein